MNTRNSNADPKFFLIVAVVVAAAFGIYTLATALGLDFKTMLGVLLLSATVVALAGGASISGAMPSSCTSARLGRCCWRWNTWPGGRR